MVNPLALLYYENLMPGSQIVNRLQDLGYRVQVINGPEELAGQAREGKPLLIVADLARRQTELCGVIKRIRADSDTSHIPVLAFAPTTDAQSQAAAVAAGANLVAATDGVLGQLPQLVQQVLEVH